MCLDKLKANKNENKSKSISNSASASGKPGGGGPPCFILLFDDHTYKHVIKTFKVSFFKKKEK